MSPAALTPERERFKQSVESAFSKADGRNLPAIVIARCVEDAVRNTARDAIVGFAGPYRYRALDLSSSDTWEQLRTGALPTELEQPNTVCLLCNLPLGEQGVVETEAVRELEHNHRHLLNRVHRMMLLITPREIDVMLSYAPGFWSSRVALVAWPERTARRPTPAAPVRSAAPPAGTPPMRVPVGATEPKDSIRGQISMARHLVEKGRVNEAGRLTMQTLSQAERSGDRVSEGACFHLLGLCSERDNDLPAARSYYKQAIASYREADEPVADLVVACERLALIHHRSGEPELALEVLDEALDHSDQLGDPRRVAAGCRRVGALLERIGDLGSALECARRALKIETKEGNVPWMLRGYAQLARLNRLARRMDDARTYVAKGLGLSDQEEDDQIQAILLCELGCVHLDENHPADALEALREAYAIQERLQDVAGAGRTLAYVGVALAGLGSRKEGEDLVVKGLDLLEQVSSPEAEHVRGILDRIRSGEAPIAKPTTPPLEPVRRPPKAPPRPPMRGDDTKPLDEKTQSKAQQPSAPQPPTRRPGSSGLWTEEEDEWFPDDDDFSGLLE